MAHTVERLRDDVRKERARADRARLMSRDIDDVTDSGPLFNDPAEQFRHELYLEWAKRIPAGSKAETPLAEYGFADGYMTTGRDMHRLRGGVAGTSGFVEDPELGTAWRAALQAKTASARRVHCWRGTDRKIVFATVGLHDDMDIYRVAGPYRGLTLRRTLMPTKACRPWHGVRGRRSWTRM
jgi:hypothetical protein